MKKWLSLLFVFTLVASVMSFSSIAMAADTTTVTFSTEGLYLAVGQATTPKVSVKPYAANKKGLSYTISDESIATVSTKGRVTAMAVGTCQLTATSVYDESVSASIPVSVIKPVEDVTITAESNTVFIGQTLQLTATCSPMDATVQTVTFSSSSDSVAAVTADGLVTGVKRGKATITAKTDDGFATAKYTVNVQQQTQSIDITPESVAAAAGRKVQLKATVLPKDANDKSVTWVSGDENIATVNTKGQVTIVGVGETQVTATCNDNPSVTATVPVQGMELAQSIAFDAPTYSVLINETVQLYPIVLPSTTTDQSVTYKVKNNRIASVDENGLVTGLKGGKTTVYAYTADGSKKRAAATLEVIVPVTGVSYKYKDVRVGAGSYGTFTAEIKPSSATNKAMTWVSSDEGVATVSGTTNRFKISGRRWGRCVVTGTTADGGFKVEVNVDVGSLRHAVTIQDVSIKNGKPYITLRNRSDMNISQVRFQMRGYDNSLQPIVMSTTNDPYTLEGSYNLALESGDRTEHGRFTFYRPTNYAGLEILQFTITGWSTDTGYYDQNGQLQYNYNISSSKWEWVTYPPNINPLAQ